MNKKKKLIAVKAHPMTRSHRMSGKGRVFWNIFGIVIISLLGFIIYSNIFGNTAHFDDLIWQLNPAVNDLGRINELFSFAPFRFITFISFAINYQLHNLDLSGYYLTNIIIHILNSILVWQLIHLTLSAPVFQGKKNKNINLLAIIGALIFLTHPLQTQAVTYIYQRLTSLATLFYLTSLCCYVKARLLNQKDYKKVLLFIVSALSCLAGMFSKENTFTLPLMMLIYELFFLKNKVKFSSKKLIFILLIILIGAGLFLAFFGVERAFETRVNNDGEIINSFNYLLTQFQVIPTYFKLLILPINQNIDHHFTISQSIFELPTVFGLILILAVFAFAIIIYKKNRLVSFGIFWIYLTLSIESSIIPIMDVMFEHRLYLPIVGFAFILIGIANNIKNVKYNKVFIVILLAFIGINSILTFERNKVWKNELTLWNDAIAKSPEKPRPYFARGKYYDDKNKSGMAFEAFNKAIQLNPKFEPVYLSRGIIFLKQKQYKKAISDFNKYISFNNPNKKGYFNRGNAYLEIEDYDNAIADYKVFIKAHPNFPITHFSLGKAYFESGDHEKAIESINKAIELNYNDYNVYLLLAKILSLSEKYQDAIINFTKAAKINPNEPLIYFNRATIYFYMNEFDSAIADYDNAIKLNPNLIDAYKYQGIAYERKGDINKAIERYSKAIEINNNDWQLYDLRGKAYLKSGNIQKAIADFNSIEK